MDKRYTIKELLKKKLRKYGQESKYELVVNSRPVFRIDTDDSNPPNTLYVNNYKVGWGFNYSDDNYSDLDLLISERRVPTDKELGRIINHNESRLVEYLKVAMNKYGRILEDSKFVENLIVDNVKLEKELFGILGNITVSTEINMDNVKEGFRDFMGLFIVSLNAACMYQDNIKIVNPRIISGGNGEGEEDTASDNYEEYSGNELDFDNGGELIYKLSSMLREGDDVNYIHVKDTLRSTNLFINNLLGFMKSNYYISNNIDSDVEFNNNGQNIKDIVNSMYDEIFRKSINSCKKELGEMLQQDPSMIDYDAYEFKNNPEEGTDGETYIDYCARRLESVLVYLFLKELLKNCLIGYNLSGQIIDKIKRYQTFIKKYFPTSEEIIKSVESITELRNEIRGNENKVRKLGEYLPVEKAFDFLEDMINTTTIYGIDLGEYASRLEPDIIINDVYQIIFITTPAFKAYRSLRQSFLTDSGFQCNISREEFFSTEDLYYMSVVENYNTLYCKYIKKFEKYINNDFTNFVSWGKTNILPFLVTADGIFNPYTHDLKFVDCLRKTKIYNYMSTEIGSMESMFIQTKNNITIHYIPLDILEKSLNIENKLLINTQVVPYMLASAIYHDVIVQSGESSKTNIFRIDSNMAVYSRPLIKDSSYRQVAHSIEVLGNIMQFDIPLFSYIEYAKVLLGDERLSNENITVQEIDALQVLSNYLSLSRARKKTLVDFTKDSDRAREVFENLQLVKE